MNLTDLTPEELIELADNFGVAVTQDLNSEQIIARFVEDGVTQKMVDDLLAGKLAAQAEAAALAAAELEAQTAPKKAGGRPKKAVAVAVVEEADTEQSLIFMDRENGTYKVRGYTFTREHPFVLVSDPRDAEFIVEHDDGFSYATPKQAREYYS